MLPLPRLGALCCFQMRLERVWLEPAGLELWAALPCSEPWENRPRGIGQDLNPPG